MSASKWVRILLLSILALASTVLLGCDALPLPVDMTRDLSDFKQGSYTLPITSDQSSVSGTFYLPNRDGYALTFDPPQPPPSGASLRFRIRYQVTGPELSGLAYLQIYFAPPGEDAFAASYALGNPVALILDGNEHSASGTATLSAEQLRLLNTGSAVVGLALTVQDLTVYGSQGAVEFSWEIEELVAEVALF